MVKINNYDILSQYPKIYVKINQEFYSNIRTKIIKEHNSLKRYCDKYLNINYPTLKVQFQNI